MANLTQTRSRFGLMMALTLAWNSSLHLTGCSQGTEVGNGVKPADAGQGGGITDASMSGKQTVVNSSASAPQLPLPAGPAEGVLVATASTGDSSSVDTLNSAHTASAGSIAASPSMGSANTAYTTVSATDLSSWLDPALGGCASPLSEALLASATYRVTVAGEVVTVRTTPSTGGKSWLVYKGAGNLTASSSLASFTLVRRITPSAATSAGGDYSVTAQDAAGAILSTGLQCAAVSSAPNTKIAGQTGVFTKRTVSLSPDLTTAGLFGSGTGTDGAITSVGGVAAAMMVSGPAGSSRTLTWYVAPAPGDPSHTSVARIELSGMSGADLVVFTGE